MEEEQNGGDSTTAPGLTGEAAPSLLPDSTTKLEGGTSGSSLDSLTAATPRYFVLYVAAARFILLFSVAVSTPQGRSIQKGRSICVWLSIRIERKRQPTEREREKDGHIHR